MAQKAMINKQFVKPFLSDPINFCPEISTEAVS
jgi:hypothetical protein